MDADNTTRATPAVAANPGELVRRARTSRGLTLTQLGALTGFSAAQVSRYERGISALTDVTVLRAFAEALGIEPKRFGLACLPDVRHGRVIGPAVAYPRLPTSRVSDTTGREDGDDPVRRRQLLGNLAVTAAAAAIAKVPVPSHSNAGVNEAALGDVLVARLRDAMLGLHHDAVAPADPVIRTDLTRALTDFHTCRYSSLAARLPRLLRAGHAQVANGDGAAVLARSYLLATRILIKLDEPQLGWMAADRARHTAEAVGDVLLVAEAARNLAVLARKAGWYDQAMSLALTAADQPDLRGGGPDYTAERGLLIQSAAYTAARAGDAAGMRELTGEAAAHARDLGGTTLLRDHGGGFSPITVQLHLISAENSVGDPSTALAAARALSPQRLPTVERRARYYTDIATASARWSRRDDCLQALLAAERVAPEETHARPAVKSLVSGLLISGRTSTELRGLAARTGVLT